MIREGGDSAQVGQGAGHGSGERGTGGDRGSPSRALALSRFLVPGRAVRCPRSVPLRCRWPRYLARAFALAPCRVRLGLPPAFVPGQREQGGKAGGHGAH